MHRSQAFCFFLAFLYHLICRPAHLAQCHLGFQGGGISQGFIYPMLCPFPSLLQHPLGFLLQVAQSAEHEASPLASMFLAHKIRSNSMCCPRRPKLSNGLYEKIINCERPGIWALCALIATDICHSRSDPYSRADSLYSDALFSPPFFPMKAITSWR